MVRFSDMLGGNGDNEATRATTVPEAVPPVDEAVLAEEAEEAEEPDALEATDTAITSPEEVLDRLTQYATSARAAEPIQPAAAPTPTPTDVADSVAESDTDDLTPVGDDFLPHGKGEVRRPSRRNKRRP